MIDDDIANEPWHCGHDDGCAVGWHLASYRYDDDGTLICAKYGPGDPDWDACDEEDIPSYERQQASWAEYYRHVINTGEDPLGAFWVKDVHERQRRFIARAQEWIGQKERGLMFGGLRSTSHHRPIYLFPNGCNAAGRRFGWTLPKEAWEYLDLVEVNGRWFYPEFHTLEQMQKEACVDRWITPITYHRKKYPGLAFEFHVTCRTPRSEQAIRRDLRRLARRALEKKE